MKQNWVDCPVCGAKASMRHQRGISEVFSPRNGSGPITVAGLDGHFCSSCEEGFWSSNAERQIAEALARGMDVAS